jgi:hypothetical protein
MGMSRDMLAARQRVYAVQVIERHWLRFKLEGLGGRRPGKEPGQEKDRSEQPGDESGGDDDDSEDESEGETEDESGGEDDDDWLAEGIPP